MVKASVGRPVDPNKDREILSAGRKLLFGDGPQAVTMEAVARLAGVSKPTLYRRWANRDELLAAVAACEAETMSAQFRMMPDSAADLRQALVGFGCKLTRFLLSADHIRFIHALGASQGLPQSARESIYRHGPLAMRNRLADWLERADSAGLLACRDPQVSAERFLGMLMGLDLVRQLYRVHPPRDVSALDARVESTVDDFLALHARDE